MVQQIEDIVVMLVVFKNIMLLNSTIDFSHTETAVSSIGKSDSTSVFIAKLH